jgi:hypothetical protein
MLVKPTVNPGPEIEQTAELDASTVMVTGSPLVAVPVAT